MEQRKRGLEDDEPAPDGEAKRTSLGNCALKLLLPNQSAGTVIGKGGQIINQIQADSGARVKLSQNREFFPGTTDRVVLIQGPLEAVIRGAMLVMTNAIHPPEHEPKDPPETPRQIKLTIPSGSSGSVIGRGGEVIKNIQVQTGARVQLAHKEQEIPGVLERIVTVSGTFEQCSNAITFIIRALSEFPDGFAYHNLSTAYSGLSSRPPARPAAPGPAYPPQPSFHPPQHYGSYPPSSYPQYDQPPSNYGPPAPGGFMGSYPPPQPSYGGQPAYSAPPAPNATGGASGFSVVPQPIPSQSGSYPPSATSPNYTSPAASYTSPAASYPPPSSSYATPASAYPPSSGAPITIAVPEEHVGAILGRGGSVIAELQQYSGARIQLSPISHQQLAQKGEFIPGTRSRTLTITGTPQACQTAHYLVTQKLQEASSREKSGPYRQ